MSALPDKYRPRTLADVVGQEPIVRQLRTFAADPYPAAFLFHGPTGSGKTSAAIAFANDFGVATELQEPGGFFTIPSGEQTEKTVRAVVGSLALIPMNKSGWRVIVVNEVDRMSEGAAFVWLDILEALPPRCVFIFTTNDAQNLRARFRDRCESFRFAPATPAGLATYVERVWTGEGRTDAPPTLAGGSFRRALQELAPILRAGGDALAAAVEDTPTPPRTSPWWTVAALALAGLAAVAVILATGEAPREG